MNSNDFFESMAERIIEKAVKEKVSAAEAEEIKGKLEAAGATVTIK